MNTVLCIKFDTDFVCMLSSVILERWKSVNTSTSCFETWGNGEFKVYKLSVLVCRKKITKEHCCSRLRFRLFFALDFFFFFFLPYKRNQFREFKRIQILWISLGLKTANTYKFLKPPSVPLFSDEMEAAMASWKACYKTEMEVSSTGHANRGVWHKFIHFSPL